MQPSKIVMHFKDGRIRKGSTNDFSPKKRTFRVVYLNGRKDEIEVESLKALFFVKDMTGNRDYQYRYRNLIAGGGRKVRVNFEDGETIIGYVRGHEPDQPGFMLTPADADGNNDQIYVVKSSTKSIDFSGMEEKRKYYRAQTANTISYEGLVNDDGSGESGMGEALDISQGGLLLETKSPIKSKYVLLTAIDSREQLLHIKGEVIYCRRQAPNCFHSGIQYVETTDSIRRIVVEMVKAFLKTKEEGG